ncbi:MAG: ferritin family protein, partial [Planctomycetota bacterium]
MKKFSSVDEILNVAIASESKAHELYIEMAAMVEDPWMRRILEGFAQEELQHRAKLVAVKNRKITLEREEVGDLGITDTLEDTQPHAKMDYRELLVFAIKKEDSAQKFYTIMAS